MMILLLFIVAYSIRETQSGGDPLEGSLEERSAIYNKIVYVPRLLFASTLK